MTWKITPLECLVAPAVSVLFFHNSYEEGKQGGIEILQQGVRIAGNGNLRLGPAPDQWDALPRHENRQVMEDQTGLKIRCEYIHPHIGYRVSLFPKGEALHLRVELEQPLPAEWVGKVSFNLELIPGAYMGKSYVMDASSGIFPRQFDSPVVHRANGILEPEPLARGKQLTLSPEDPLTRLSFRAEAGELCLLDGRYLAQNGWFIVRSLVPGGVRDGVIEWVITPNQIPGWKRKPVICYSQVGYHPRQKKRAVIEFGEEVPRLEQARLMRIDTDGQPHIEKAAQPDTWGAYLAYRYATFDFSEVAKPGMYCLAYGGETSQPFPILESVYEKRVWQPTLEQFLPIQMCHVEVRDLYRVWHGACHLDDALQAPLEHAHFDSYIQYTETETPYAPLAHIPHLDVGGWHDAGDYDLAAGSQARTTYVLALAREVFGIDTDQTTVNREKRQVIMHLPDGIPDIVQQVTHGVENLLSGYRAAGHSFVGIIESTLTQYVHLGDPATMTDNRVSEGLPAGVSDDRWVFTNRDTSLEYQVCGALAASSRVLRGWDESLATECLDTAASIWSFEQANPVRTARNCYVPGHPETMEILAASELLITTQEDKYRQHILTHLPVILENIPAVGWSVAKALPFIGDAPFERGFSAAVKAYCEWVVQEAQGSPFGVAYSAETWLKEAPVWGVAWSILHRAVGLYYLHQPYPDLVPRELVIAAVEYVLGCHPVSNDSLVSGVGSKSLTIAYGINRADWTYTPGGVVSGPALILPNYLELQDPFPFLWMQKEYVIGGAADYIFCVLAANELLKG